MVTHIVACYWMRSWNFFAYWNHQKKPKMNKLIEKLKEPSTYRGLAIIGGVIGITLTPQAWDTIGAAIAAIIGVIEIFRKEK